jgi:hypothetical protein
MTSWDGQTERYYLLRVPSFEFRPALGHDALRAEWVTETRWWTLDELEAARDVVFAPLRLATLLRELLGQGPPETPIDVGV